MIRGPRIRLLRRCRSRPPQSPVGFGAFAKTGGLRGRSPCSPSRLTQNRLRALVFIQLSEHADLKGKAALERRLLAAPEVQFCYEIAGPHDLVLLFDCANMAEYNAAAEELLASSATVRRYETHFVKREVKFAPFVELGA